MMDGESSRPGRGSSTSSSVETTGVGGVGGGICLSCGSPAKKECPYSRCRTCCESGRFECATHVRSTWVCARERREQRLQQLHGQHRQDHERPNASGSGLVFLDDFPAEVSCHALLRRVMVNTSEQFAYKVAVNIGGRVFRGVLHPVAANPNVAVGDSLPSTASAATMAESRIANAGVPSSATSPCFDVIRSSSDDSI